MNTVLQIVFWISAVAVVYSYVGYPVVLSILSKLRARRNSGAANQGDLPSITMIVPVHNEERHIDAKLQNTRALAYPGQLVVLFISDGSTDGTVARLRAGADDRIKVLEVATRGGKASALNLGLTHATNDVVVFSDASIMLEPSALVEIVRPLRDPEIGCVSGEDHIAQFGGESLYGRYELSLRRMESDLFSIVGASGSFYAQRRSLCKSFPAGLAPDFLSVLETVQQGYRAVCAPAAVGTMEALHDPKAEFGRKVRTILRGITTVAYYRSLLNPLAHGWFAFELWSHKLSRWLVPFFLMAMFIASVLLARESMWYRLIAFAQLAFYACAAIASLGASRLAQSLPGKVSLYFTSANIATITAWLQFLRGHRQEIWSPSRR